MAEPRPFGPGLFALPAVLFSFGTTCGLAPGSILVSALIALAFQLFAIRHPLRDYSLGLVTPRISPSMLDNNTVIFLPA